MNCAARQTGPCRCYLSCQTLEKLKNLTAQYHEQIKTFEKLSREVGSSGKHRTSADQSIKSIFENIDALKEKNEGISKAMKSQIHQIFDRQAHIDHHRKETAEAEKQALKFIAGGTKSAIYEIPESLGGLVLKVGPIEAIKQERLNILSLTHAREKLEHSIWSGSRQGWLKPLLIPNVEAFVPTGWARDDSTGVLRHCENLDPRISGFHDMCVDSDEQIGIVLSRIGDLEDDCSRMVLQRCYNFEDPRFPGLEETLRANDHCLIRIYLGKLSDEDSISDVAMKDAVDDGSITNSDKSPLSTLNLPGYLDHVVMACGEDKPGPALESFAREIAFGYALLHWGARLDARGIEFLMGSSPTGLGKRFYMLDFEDCRPIGELTAECVRHQLIPAALENDPYIPRAINWGSNDEKKELCEQCKKHGRDDMVRIDRQKKVCTCIFVWIAFVEFYHEASTKIWEARNRDFDLGLAELFIQELRKISFDKDVERSLNGVSDHRVT